MDIASWLRGLGLGRYEQAFRDNAVDAEILPRLTGDDLKEIGVLAVGHRRKLLEAISALGEGPPATQADARTARPSAAQAPGPLAAEAERRQLTVMFVDLVGSTALSARLDPEVMREILDAYQNAVAGEVARFGGHLAKFMGDGVLAYFGWPAAQEDMAERAVRAGLDIVTALSRVRAPAGEALAVRVGIATGLVVVGDLVGVGGPEARERAVVGETPNLAARLQSLAGPGHILIDLRTRRRLGRLFDLTDLGSQPLKGFADPIPVWRVSLAGERQSRFEALRGRLLSQLVGRTTDQETIERAAAQAAVGQGQTIAFVGEAGVGKSRLLHDCLRSDAFRGWQVRRCACPSYASATSWLPVIDMLKRRFGIDDRDDAERNATKLRAGLERLGDAAQGLMSAFLALLDLAPPDEAWRALNAPQRRRRILDAVRALLLLDSGVAPLVLIIEDLHWADSETLALVDGLIATVPAQPILLLLNYRPGFAHAWHGRGTYVERRLDPLSPDEVGQLLGSLIGDDPSLDPLKRHLNQRAGGNPLFLEEAVRDLVESGAFDGAPGTYRLTRNVAAIRIPDTVEAVITGRIDRLPPEAKHVLQRAAVAGHDIALPVLEAVAELPPEGLRHALDELRAADMLYETRLVPDPTYSFKHALVHEVAYGGLLLETRRRLHRRIGEAVESVYAGRLGELAEALANHFERGEVWAKAAHYAMSAAEKAKARYDYSTGLRFAARAAEAAARDPDLEADWIGANVLLGDLASLADDLNLANRSYDAALTKSQVPDERRHIANRRHRPSSVVRDGARIVYYEHGGGDETIVLVTPLSYGLAPWQPVIERLCQEFRIITLDARGTGQSDPIVRPYLAKDHGHDVAAVVRAAGGWPVTAVGISRSSATIVHAALAEPRAFKGLVMAGTLAEMPGPGTPLYEQSKAEYRLLADGKVEASARRLVETVIDEPGTEDLREQLLRAFLRVPLEAVHSFYDPRPPEDNAIIPMLNRLCLPTLILHGTADKRVPFTEAERIAASVATAQLYAFEGRSHLCMTTATNEFCDVLTRFVRGEPLRRPGPSMSDPR